MTPLAAIERRRKALRRSQDALNEAIREAVKTEAKVDIAKAAGISRPTLDRILSR